MWIGRWIAGCSAKIIAIAEIFSLQSPICLLEPVSSMLNGSPKIRKPCSRLGRQQVTTYVKTVHFITTV